MNPTLNLINPVEGENAKEVEKDDLIDKGKSLKREKDEDLDNEYVDRRYVTIASIRKISNYRSVNIAVLGPKIEVIGSSIKSSKTLASNKGEIEAYFPNIIGISPTDTQ